MPHHTHRPLADLAFAVLLAALAGCGAKTSVDRTQVVAKVNDSEISVHQINQVLQRQPGLQPEQADRAGREVLERLIEQELAVQQAGEMKLERDPQVMQSLAAARREVLARAYATKVADSATRPEPKDVQAYYDAHPALFAGRRIFVLQEYAIQAEEAVVEKLRKSVAAARSINDINEQLRSEKVAVRVTQNTQPAEALPPALVERLMAMKDGQAMLIAAPGGARLIAMLASRAAPMPLERAQAGIEQALLAERRRDAVQSGISSLRKASQVAYYGKFAEPAAAATAASAPPPAAAAAPATSTREPAAVLSVDGAASGSLDEATVGKGLAGLK